MVYLGSWHIYKMITTCVWRLYAPSFIGPLFHMLFPNSKFPGNPRLILSSRILTLLRLAYPSISTQLANALARATESSAEHVHLTNLRHLFEYFIPKVTFLSLTYHIRSV